MKAPVTYPTFEKDPPSHPLEEWGVWGKVGCSYFRDEVRTIDGLASNYSWTSPWVKRTRSREARCVYPGRRGSQAGLLVFGSCLVTLFMLMFPSAPSWHSKHLWDAEILSETIILRHRRNNRTVKKGKWNVLGLFNPHPPAQCIRCMYCSIVSVKVVFVLGPSSWGRVLFWCF